MVFESLHSTRRLHRRAVFVACILFAMLSMCFCAGKSDGKEPRTVARYLRHIHPGATQGTPTLGFLLRFLDFGCTPCLNNFLDFCDTLKETMARKGERDILMVFLRDDNTEQHQRATLNKWAKVNGVPFPVYLASEEVYARYHIGHSCAVLVNEMDAVEFTDELPLPAESREIILHRLFGDR